MDERLKAALDSANFMITFNNQRELIKQTFKENCLYHENGRRFTVNRELINFLSTLISRGVEEDVVILDDMEIPYMVSDLNEFLDKIFDIYVESTNQYYHDYTDIVSKRSVDKIVEV
jgi:hypothetical protein